MAWSIVLPVIGSIAVLATMVGLAFWQYMGHDAAYVAAQKWVQQEFGSLQASSNNTAIKPENTSMIPLTNEATPDLQIDRHLTLKTTP
jgi:hypothetical protein